MGIVDIDGVVVSRFEGDEDGISVGNEDGDDVGILVLVGVEVGNKDGRNDKLGSELG